MPRCRRTATTGTQIMLRIATTTPSALGAEPVEPAEGEFALLVGGQAAGARQEAAPVLLGNLEPAIGPAVALLLEGLEGVGQQAMAVAAIGVMGQPAVLDDRQPEIGVLADGVARPAAAPVRSRARRIRHMVPCTMMALASLRWTMPMSKKPAYSPFIAHASASGRRRDDPAAPAPGRPADRRTPAPDPCSQSGLTT